MTDADAAVSARQQQRREDLAAAVWRVLDEAGFAGLSMRAVAAQMGASTGVVTHHFSSKRELTTFALHLLAERSAARVRRSAEVGLPALRAALLDMLPLEAASRTANRIWVSSWDAALADARHAADHAERYRASRDTIRRLLAATLEDDDDDGGSSSSSGSGSGADARAEVLHAAVLGLAVQAVLDPADYPAERQVQLLEELLARIAFRRTPAAAAVEPGTNGSGEGPAHPSTLHPRESTGPIRAHRDGPVPEEVARLLATVPEWFDAPGAIAAYVEAARSLETWTVRDGGQVLGATLIKRPFPQSVEIHLVVVHRAHHGRGIGTAMLRALEEDARGSGVRLLQVKTLGPSSPDLGYAKTRRFYEGFGFFPLEENQSWGQANPCLVMVKPVDAPR